jgi:hypothetical protein
VHGLVQGYHAQSFVTCSMLYAAAYLQFSLPAAAVNNAMAFKQCSSVPGSLASQAPWCNASRICLVKHWIAALPKGCSPVKNADCKFLSGHVDHPPFAPMEGRGNRWLHGHRCIQKSVTLADLAHFSMHPDLLSPSAHAQSAWLAQPRASRVETVRPAHARGDHATQPWVVMHLTVGEG